MKIQFLGAADSVTGSRHLVDIGGQRILLDCGLFQGFKVHRERNWAPTPPAMLEANAVLLSHAHLDHCGYLPALVKHGYAGPIYATAATRDLAEVLLLDSAHLQEEDARRANRYGYSKHAKALPLYTRADALRAIERFVVVPAKGTLRLGSVNASFTPAGHLLGAGSVRLSHGRECLVFSGDLGRQHDLLMPPPEVQQALVGEHRVLLIESTYGNRDHPADDSAERLGQIVRETVQRGGSVLMPSFAVGRSQALLVVLQRLRAAGQIPHGLPIFVDSPMAVQATALYQRHAALLRLSAREMKGLLDGVRLITEVAQSMRLSRSRYPSVIISASGMATGGRVLHHLKAMAPEPRHHIVFPGYQVGGSRGARLIAGEREVKIHGEYVPVQASVSHLQSFSAHADRSELVDWVRRMQPMPTQAFVVHGESDASDALRLRLHDELGVPTRVPQHGEVVEV